MTTVCFGVVDVVLEATSTGFRFEYNNFFHRLLGIVAKFNDKSARFLVTSESQTARSLFSTRLGFSFANVVEVHRLGHDDDVDGTISFGTLSRFERTDPTFHWKSFDSERGAEDHPAYELRCQLYSTHVRGKNQ